MSKLIARYWLSPGKAKGDGYRYVRSYQLKSGVWRWALWERIGGKARRVGTAYDEQEYRSFLGIDSPIPGLSIPTGLQLAAEDVASRFMPGRRHDP